MLSFRAEGYELKKGCGNCNTNNVIVDILTFKNLHCDNSSFPNGYSFPICVSINRMELRILTVTLLHEGTSNGEQW